MDALDICLCLATYCLGLLAAFGFELARAPTKSLALECFAVLISLPAISYVGMLIGGESFDLLLRQVLLEGKPRPLLMALAGLATGISWGTVNAVSARTGRPDLRISVMTAGAILFVVATGLVLAWDNAFDIERFRASVHDERYTIQEIARTEQAPVRLALDQVNDRLYFSTYSTGVNGVFSGSIFYIPLSLQSPPPPPILAASSPVLYRTFGLACRNGDVFVSRAGHAAHANQGRIEYDHLGAVTQLKDLDGDGQLEYFDDVIAGIPAARGPDTMHQNNGIAFDDAGNLYVNVGSADDRSIDQHPWSGTVLRLKPGNDGPGVFARGLRNPFGVCVGPGDGLFVTDNDCAEDPGDEVNFVTEGSHQGHPFNIPGAAKVTGLTEAILIGPDSNYCGVAYRRSPESPETSGTLFVCDRLRNSILQLKVELNGGGISITENRVLARVPSPIDIAVSEVGELFVASLGKKRIYRIQPR
ncbi:MAG: PQQ-dependent sugar dehydrogenase [Fuerstiella sp.]